MEDKALLITNHNRYDCINRSYDGYSVMVLDSRRYQIRQWPPRLLIAEILREDLGITSMQNIKIDVTWTLISATPPQIGMFFFDPVESVLFKLNYMP